MNDEEVAFRIVRLYFEEIARLGFKRQLDLDQIVNAYFYTLRKMKDKDAIKRAVMEFAAEEKATKKEVIRTTTVTTAQTVPVVKETTTTTVTEEPKTKSVTDIVEEK